jgi:hypothetical protein
MFKIRHGHIFWVTANGSVYMKRVMLVNYQQENQILCRGDHRFAG